MGQKKKTKKKHSPRFGIGEWFGMSFIGMSPQERFETANAALSHSPKREDTCPTCPFQKRADGEFKPCKKKGGVCSLRLYESADGKAAQPAPGNAGELVTICPQRFAQDNIVFEHVGRNLLETDELRIINEVRFLQRLESHDSETEENESEDNSKEREDVGNIDRVLVHPTAIPLRWCALEIQAVYFSGTKMSELFTHIRDWKDSTIPFPDRTRRPDYRSSGPKRLMPQLQIKVPALRRWGKKMAVIVDEAFFKNLGQMEVVKNGISNCDIVWFVMGFDERSNPVRLVPKAMHLTTLERAVEGLTNGLPVSLEDFEKRIQEKLSEQDA